MNFECYLCDNKYFNDNNLVVEHLKKEHKIKEKVHQLKCTVKNSRCGKNFLTFYGLNRHVRTCLNDKINLNADISSVHTADISCEIEPVQSFKSRRPNSFLFNFSNEDSNNINENEESFVCDENGCAPNASSKEDQSFVLNSSKESSDVHIETPSVTTTNFFAGLLQLNLNDKVTNDIFRLTEILLIKTYQFCSQSIKTHINKPLEALDCSMNLAVDGLQRFNSSYKRKQFLQNHKSYIEPQQYCIGTHWEMERDNSTKILEPVHKQSKFSYVPPLEILSHLFKKPHFREAYFAHQANKHTCVPNIYRDFCCGSAFEKIDLFKEHPNSLQLQIFIDGFEICSALKTKTTMHSQVAVYLMVRNMPVRFAHNMSNVHLICLVNENDLKKKETDYTNILEIIVRDIKILETSGIDLDCNTNLKGKISEILSLVLENTILLIFNHRYNCQCNF